MKKITKRIMALMLSFVMILGGIPSLVNIVKADYVDAWIFDTSTGEPISFLEGVNSSKKLNQLKVGVSYDQSVDISYEIENDGVYESVDNTDVNFIAGKKYRLTLQFDKGCSDDYAVDINDFYVSRRYGDEAIGLFYNHNGENPRNYSREGSVITTRFEGIATETPVITSVTIDEQIIAGDNVIPVTIQGNNLTGVYSAEIYTGTKTLQEIIDDDYESYFDSFSARIDTMTLNCTEESVNLYAWEYELSKGTYTLAIAPIMRYGAEEEIIDDDYKLENMYIKHFTVDAWEIGTQPSKNNGYEVSNLNTSSIARFEGLQETYLWQRTSTVEPSVIDTLDNSLLGTGCEYIRDYYLPVQFISYDGKYKILSYDDQWYYDMINDSYDGVKDDFDYSLLNNGYQGRLYNDYYYNDLLLASEDLNVGSKITVELDSQDPEMNWNSVSFYVYGYGYLDHDEDSLKKCTFIVTEDMLNTSDINNIRIYNDAYSPYVVKKITIENETWEDLLSETTNKLSNLEDGYTYRCKVTCGDNTIYSSNVTYEEPGAPGPEPAPSSGSSKKYKASDSKDTAEKVSGSGKKGSTRTITPIEGKKVSSVIVTDKDGNKVDVTLNEDGTYSFKQPASDVTIEVSYKNREITLNIGSTEAEVDGEKSNLDVCPVVRNDRTMLPIRYVAENLGAKVEWSEKKPDYVAITRGDTKIEITLGSDIMLVNGKEVKLDSVAFAENDRTYLPVRAISEALNAIVEWNEEKPMEVKIYER